eukprot:3423754-Heterocapsa_arctica.AAC.1
MAYCHRLFVDSDRMLDLDLAEGLASRLSASSDPFRNAGVPTHASSFAAPKSGRATQAGSQPAGQTLSKRARQP